MKPITEKEEAERGELLARVLKLRKDPQYHERWQTTWGNKTAIGLYRIVNRIIEDGE